METPANPTEHSDPSVRPDSNGPRLAARALPDPVPLRKMLGPSVLLLAVSLGSGEFVIFPKITVTYGFVMMWAALVGFATQYILNMEIERYTLACGETVTTGFGRMWVGWAWVMLACNVIAWAWPGWATGSAQCVAFLFQLEQGHVRYCAIAGLVALGLAISLGPVIYRTTIAIQAVLVAVIVLFMIVICAAMFRVDAIGPFFKGLLGVGRIPAGIDLKLLMTALAFAGAGGSLNLCQSHYIREKGYGMAAYIGRLRSPITGGMEPMATTGSCFDVNSQQLSVWRRGWWAARTEHFITFFCLGVASVFLLCFIAYCAGLADPEAGRAAMDAKGLGFVNVISLVIQRELGTWGRCLFLLMGAAILLTTELGVLWAVGLYGYFTLRFVREQVAAPLVEFVTKVFSIPPT